MRWDSSGPSNVGSSGSSISSVQFSIRTLLVPMSAIGKIRPRGYRERLYEYVHALQYI